ncbi:MAG: hypothetical protein LV481_13625 [Methylacidiphilales bacterium]|nr:hypothetical protein [Candidatus Methylacidiphilales bacterium]
MKVLIVISLTLLATMLACRSEDFVVGDSTCYSQGGRYSEKLPPFAIGGPGTVMSFRSGVAPLPSMVGLTITDKEVVLTSLLRFGKGITLHGSDRDQFVAGRAVELPSGGKVQFFRAADPHTDADQLVFYDAEGLLTWTIDVFPASMFRVNK